MIAQRRCCDNHKRLKWWRCSHIINFWKQNSFQIFLRVQAAVILKGTFPSPICRGPCNLKSSSPDPSNPWSWKEQRSKHRLASEVSPGDFGRWFGRYLPRETSCNSRFDHDLPWLDWLDLGRDFFGKSDITIITWQHEEIPLDFGSSRPPQKKKNRCQAWPLADRHDPFPPASASSKGALKPFEIGTSLNPSKSNPHRKILVYIGKKCHYLAVSFQIFPDLIGHDLMFSQVCFLQN